MDCCLAEVGTEQAVAAAGAWRAENGNGGWKPVTGETLNARQGYAFQTSHTGNLTVSFPKIEPQPDGSLKVQAQVANGETLCTKLSATFR